MSQEKQSLWKRFVAIAQPYFFPLIPRGGWVMLLLLIMLFISLFGVLFLTVSGLVMITNFFAPALVAKTAGGLPALVTNVFTSKAWLIVAGMLFIPAACFMIFGGHLKNRRRAWALLAVVLLLSLSVTGINVIFSYIGNYFTNAIVKKNQDMCYTFVAIYFCGFLVGIPIVAFYNYVQNYLGMRWREWMTGDFLGKYFKNRSYYEIEMGGQIDNPDQRIMEDVRTFTRVSLEFLLIILGAVMDIVAFSGILWSKSKLLVGVVLGYSLIGTLLTVWIGRRLVRLNFNQLRYEADFRYSLIHVRDNAESIAFYQGEKPEVETITNRFRNVLGNFNLLIGWQRNLSFFTTAYRYLPIVLPYLILFPLYFGGKLEYGDMVQANYAFIQVYGALSVIVAQIEGITNFAAGVERLSTFSDAVKPELRQVGGIASADADRFAVNDLTLLTPNKARTLFSNLTVDLPVKDNLVVVGSSGVGKSSLLRAIAGLWTQGKGIVKRPALKDIFFLPQRPYMLLGTLRDQLIYPQAERQISNDELVGVLKQANLEGLPERVGGFDVALDWADVLSLGEQQRLAFARLLVNRPKFAVLDEATSALDMDNEANLYGKLKELDIHYISVGHRSSILQYHNYVLDLKSRDAWRLTPVKDYQENQPAV